MAIGLLDRLLEATLGLVKMCNITAGQYVLDIGCGTGYTACLLAKKHQARVVASDINPDLLEEAKKRISREDVSDSVTVEEADAHDLPFPDDTLDQVIAESVLVFCDKVRAASEIRRVLNPSGVFGDTESTYTRPPPAEFAELMAEASRTSGGNNAGGGMESGVQEGRVLGHIFSSLSAQLERGIHQRRPGEWTEILRIDSQGSL